MRFLDVGNFPHDIVSSAKDAPKNTFMESANIADVGKSFVVRILDFTGNC